MPVPTVTENTPRINCQSLTVLLGDPPAPPQPPDRDTALFSRQEEGGNLLSASPPSWGPGEEVGWGGDCQGHRGCQVTVCQVERMS